MIERERKINRERDNEKDIQTEIDLIIHRYRQRKESEKD
jgi:hypothetical protein